MARLGENYHGSIINNLQLSKMTTISLTPSERATRLSYIATHLANEDWAVINMTLHQFALPKSDPLDYPWAGNLLHYVTDMIGRSDDNTLVELAHHVGFEFQDEQEQVEVVPTFWKDGMLRVFLSHISEHREFAHELKTELLDCGISAFVAHDDVEPTTEWRNEIEGALASCHSLVALLNVGFHSSYWTDQEIGWAMGRKIPVFSVNLGQAPYGFFANLQAFQGADKGTIKRASEIAGELFNAYMGNEQTKDIVAEAVMKCFDESGCFDDSDRRIGYFESLDVWHDSFNVRLHAARKNNSQISGAVRSRVSARIDALIRKWS